MIFARNHNLFMMDAENWAKAQKNANDTTIVEHQLTKDGEEHYSFGGGGRGGGGNSSNSSSRNSRSSRNRISSSEEQERQDPNRRVRAGNVVWARDSSKFALIRRDSRKVKDLWVIDSLAQPAADARDLSLRHAG